MSEGTRARGRLMPAPFAMPFRGSCVAWLLVAPLVFRAPRWDGGSIPPISTTWCCWCSGCRRPRLWGPAAVCAGGRRPAREIATREPAARSGRSRGPPWPCRRPPAPRPGPATARGCRSLALRSLRRPPHSGAWSLMCGSARRIEARPGPAMARVHWKSLA